MNIEVLANRRIKIASTSVLDALAEARVFNVSKHDGLYCFEESCDNWFFVDLTREQVLLLIDELRALVEINSLTG